MNGLTGKAALDTQDLRERNISLQTNGDDEARKAVLHLNALEENGEKQEKDKKTFGRTPDGIGKGSGFAQKRETLAGEPICTYDLHPGKLIILSSLYSTIHT